MSRFSGKCDLYDTVEMIYCKTDEEVQNFIDNAEFYIYENNRRHRLRITSRKELALYYPFLLSTDVHSDNKHIIVLANDSFIDIDEKERLECVFNRYLKQYIKCKRDKVEFNPDDCYKDFYSSPQKYEIEIAQRIAKDGRRADIVDIHTYMHEYYRSSWYDELVNLGWSENEAYRWVYKALFFSEEERENRINAWKENE